MTTREITYRDALGEALHEEMARDERVIVLGEDVYGGPCGYQGCFGVTRNVVQDFSDRLLDTPIAEQVIVGAAIGAAMSGLRPVAEIMYEDFVALAMDMLVNTAAKTHFMTGGGICVPMVLRAAGGATSIGPQHSQMWTSWFMHVPGLYVVLPATPYDAKGLLKTAMRKNSPVVFIEHKKLYNFKGPVPAEEYLIPFGQAHTLCPGKDVTLIAMGYMLHLAQQVAESFRERNVGVELIDPRTLCPLDVETMVQSVRKTHKCVIVAEDVRTAGPTAEIAAAIGESAFEYLDAPIGRVGARQAFIAHNKSMADYVLPGAARIEQAVQQVLDWS